MNIFFLLSLSFPTTLTVQKNEHAVTINEEMRVFFSMSENQISGHAIEDEELVDHRYSLFHYSI